jgi:hypothetical protein
MLKEQIGPAVVKSFADLQRQLEAEPDYLERFVSRDLQFGVFYWIPDNDSCFGDVDNHPWVIVVPYQRGRATVAASPRTSSRTVPRDGSEFALPADVVDGLDRDGVIVLNRRQPFPAASFGHYRYIGRLPEPWQQRLRAALLAEGHRIARASEAP